MIAFTPTDAAKVTNNSPQGATPNTSRSGFTSFNASEVPQPVAPQAPQPTTGSAGQTILPSSTLGGNLKALPGQILGAFGALGNAFTGGGANAVGQELGTTGANIGLLAQGKNPNIPVNIPKLAGGILSSGAAVAAAGAPIAGGATRLGRVAQAALGYGALGGIGNAGSAMANGTDSTSGFIKGAIGGAVAGGLGQGAIEGIGAIQAARTSPTSLQDALDVVQPTFNKKESITALERSGKQGGAVEQGTFGNYNISPDARDIKVAQSVQDVVSPKFSPIENIASVNSKIENVAENEVRPALQSNPSPFNLKTLNAYIRDNTQIPNYIKADPVLQRTYDLTRDSMLEEAAKNPKTLEGLWDSRISFDHVAETQIGGLAPTDTKVSVVKQAVLDTRRAVNDFIAESLPNGDAQFTAKMQQMNHMYEARSNIAESNYKLLNTNFITRWIKQNPIKAKALYIGGGLAGLGLLGNAATDIAHHL